MGKLNIAHHKSYHPYRRDNIERVRKDEEEARLKEEKEEGRMMLADSEARIDMLRQRAGIGEKGKKSSKRQEDEAEERTFAGSSNQLPTTNGHINLFQDIEQNMVAAITTAKKAEAKASELGVKLAPDEKELKRWYAEPNSHQASQANPDDDDKGKRDTQRKYRHDPLTEIEKQLASRSQASSSSISSSIKPHRKFNSRPLASTSSSSDPSVQARLTRESSERERALALIQRKKKEMEGNMIPSTVFGDDDDGYRDVYNRQAVQDAHRGRERRKWDRRRDW